MISASTFFIAEQRASLAHRENDIGIRAFEPQERNLAAIKTGRLPTPLTDCETLPFLLPIVAGAAEENAISTTCGGRTKTVAIRSW